MKKTFYVLLKIVVSIIISAALLLLALFLLFAWMIPEDAVLESLPPYSTKEYYSSGGFQDTTDFAKYTYLISEEALQSNAYLLPVRTDNVSQILAYIQNFEEWVRISQDFPSESYDFDKAIISTTDYFYIHHEYQEAEKAFWNYDLYLFDFESSTLYYFHNNI